MNQSVLDAAASIHALCEFQMKPTIFCNMCTEYGWKSFSLLRSAPFQIFYHSAPFHAASIRRLWNSHPIDACILQPLVCASGTSFLAYTEPSYTQSRSHVEPSYTQGSLHVEEEGGHHMLWKIQIVSSFRNAVELSRANFSLLPFTAFK